ncbi:MAG: tetratricopeptide repeat protein [Leptolyngbya sp.]|nr:tetratricopeptide repeat protein [Candidatus Melainabacteria bacterium]
MHKSLKKWKSRFSLMLFAIVATSTTSNLSCLADDEHVTIKSLRERARVEAEQEKKRSKSLIARRKARPLIDRGGTKNLLEAVNILSVVIKEEPANVRLYWERADAYTKLGRSEDAIKDYTKQIELLPTYPEAYVARGDAYKTLNKLNLSDKDYLKAAQLAPENAIVLEKVAILYQRNGNKVAAAKHFALADRARAGKLEDKDFKGAFRDRFNNQILSKPSRRAQYMFERGGYNLVRNNPKLTIEDCDRILSMTDFDLDSQHVWRYEVLLLKGRAYQKLADHESAVKTLSASIKIKPRNAQTYYVRAQSYFELGKFANCVKDCDTASKEDKFITKVVSDLRTSALAKASSQPK